MKHIKAFVSYSWDSKSHQQWVLNLVNQLRIKGIDATADVFETQTKTTHLPQMMVNKIKDSNFIIIVLTEGYAGKADRSEGGVGFEAHLMLSLLIESPDKLVFIMRHEGEYERVFPFLWKGHHAIDFSRESEFETRLDELIYRIYSQPIIFQEPLGKKPEFNTRIPTREIIKFEENKEIQWGKSPLESETFNINLPNLKRITDRDINLFLKDSFKEIINLLDSLFNQIQTANKEFEFDKEDVSTYKIIFKLYVDGTNVNTLKIWYGSMMGGNTINILYGNQMSSSDNSANEIITYSIDDNKQLKLRMSMNLFGNNKSATPKEVVEVIWKNNISHTIK